MTDPASPSPAPDETNQQAEVQLEHAVERDTRSHLRIIVTDALADLGKLGHFTEEELETLWKKISAKL
jgi:hypothetical protein